MKANLSGKSLGNTEIARLRYVPNELGTNKFSKYYIGGATGLYLFVYKEKDDGTSAKKYKIIEGKSKIARALLDENGTELTYPEFSPKLARAIALSIETGKIVDKTDKKGALFRSFAKELFERDKKSLAPNTIDKKFLRYKKFVENTLGDKPVKSITTPMIIQVLKNTMEKTDKSDGNTGHGNAQVVKSIIKQTLDIAVLNGEISYNPTPNDVHKIIGTSKVRSHPALLTNQELTDFIAHLNNIPESVVKNAMLFDMLIPLRSKTLRMLEWNEIKEEDGIIFAHIPGYKMKMRRDLKIALSDKALKIIEAQKKYKINDYVFGMVSKTGILNECSIARALERMGYTGKQSLHGFRATFKSVVSRNRDIHGISIEIDELCLSHDVTHLLGKVGGSYDRDPKLRQQKKLFDWYANYLDDLCHIKID